MSTKTNGVMALLFSLYIGACSAQLAPTDWTYIQVDSQREQWGQWDEPAWLRYFGLDMSDITGDGYLDVVAGRYVYRNPGADMAGVWPRIDLGLNVDGMLFVDVDGDPYGDVIAMALPQVYWLEAQDAAATQWQAHVIGTLPKTDHVNGQGYTLAQIVPGGRPEILLACKDGVYALSIPADPLQGAWPQRRLAPEVMDEGIGTGDLDGDGDIDIVCGRKHGERFSVEWFVNPGSDRADWQARVVGPSDHAPDRIVLADLNGDQRLDVVVSEERWPGEEPDANLYWYEQGAGHRFTRHLVVTEYSLNNLDVADMDGDGDQDLITCEHKGPQGQQKLQIFANNGQGLFTGHTIDRGKESHLGARVADMDGDGDYDIVSAAWDYPEFLHLWRNDAVTMPQHSLEPVQWQHISTRSGQIPLADVGNQAASLVFDINRDGIDDVVVAGWSQETSMVWLCKEGSQWQRYLIDQRQSHVEAGGAVCDIDGDGDLDILHGGSWASNEVWWWENPFPVFNPDTPWNRYMIKASGAKQHHDQIFGDFDGDGSNELVFWNQRARKLWIADIPSEPRAHGPWACTEIWSWPQAFKYEGLAQDDIDCDGIPDVVGGGMWFKYRGDCRYEPQSVDPEYGSSRSAVGDLIKGGRPEIVLGSGDAVGPLNLYQYRDGTWHKTTLIDGVDHGHSLQVADVNGDGHLDIFTAEMAHWHQGENDDAKLWILYGNGRGDFDITELEAAEGLGNHESKLGDLDGDGDLDILQKPFKMDTPRVPLDIWLNNGTAVLRANWSARRYRYRTLVRIGVGAYTRWDKPAEVPLDFAQLLRQAGLQTCVDPGYLAVVENRPEGLVPVVHQFDPNPDFHSSTDAGGILTFILSGITPAHQTREFIVYFGLDGDASPDTVPSGSPQVTVTRLDAYQGQESFRIASTQGDYIYHRAGAGFASLVDKEGLDWLSFHPGVGSASNSGSGGKYRGTPNMGHPEGYCHPGHTVSQTELLSQGPLKVTLASRSLDGRMACRWDIFPRYARMTVLAMRRPFWYLYEGTPGGHLDMDTDLCVRPGPDRIITTSVREKWQGDLPSTEGCEWLYFSDPRKNRSLYLVKHRDDEEVDSYWPMNEEMTVFGFGRLGIKKFMRQVPSQFTLGLCEDVKPKRVRDILLSAAQSLVVSVGPMQLSDRAKYLIH